MSFLRVMGFIAYYMAVVIGLFAAILWYGRSTYGPANNHPASVSEALGFILNPLLAAGIAGFVALVLLVLYWLAALIWPRPLRNRKIEVTALMIGLPVTLVATVALLAVVMSID